METYTETRIISLNSLYANHKKNTTFLSNLEFYFKDVLKDEPDIVRTTLQVINAQFPVSYYTISYLNDTLILNGSNIIIKRGNYNSSSLITELTSKILTATGNTYVITISRIDGKMSFSNSTTFTIFGNALGVVLGFESGITQTAVLTGLLYILDPPYPLNLLGIKKLKIFSTALSTSSFDSFGSGNNSLIKTITVNAPPFSLIVFETPTEPVILKSKTINTIDLQIFDEDNNFINFNNCNFTITLQINIIRTQPVLTSPIKSITDVLQQELEKIDRDIQTLANPQENPTQDLGDSTDNIDPSNTLDFLQYSGQI